MIERRNFRKVYQRTWSNPEFHALSDFDRVVFLYLLTGPQTNRVGLFQVKLATAADDLVRAPHDVFAGIRRVCDLFEWEFDEKASVVWIPSWWSFNPLNEKTPQNLKGYLTDLSDLPRTALIDAFCDNVEDVPEAQRTLFAEWKQALTPHKRQRRRGADLVATTPGLGQVGVEGAKDPATTPPSPSPDGVRTLKTETKTETVTKTETETQTATALSPLKPVPDPNQGKQKGKQKPIFSGARLTVWPWQMGEICRILGDHAAPFNPLGWLQDLDNAERDVIPESGDATAFWRTYLQPRLLEEIRKRGLPTAHRVVSSPTSVARGPTACSHTPRCADDAECGKKQRDALKVWEPRPAKVGAR